MANNKKIKIAVIGRSGQAEKLINITKSIQTVELETVYHPKCDRKLSMHTDDFGAVMQSDAVIIASPTYTHFEYLKRLRDYRGYIFLEKPAVSTRAETKALNSFSSNWKRRVYVNFNLLHSDFFTICNGLLHDERFGQPNSLNIYTSHGLAFTDMYKKSWRSSRKHSYGVAELVGTHYINLAINLFGNLVDKQATGKTISGRRKNAPPDFVEIKLLFKNSVTVNLSHSYAGPYFNKIFFIGTNGFFQYDGKIGEFYSPRETFDKNKRFCSPPLVNKFDLNYADVWNSSVVKSLNNFFEKVQKNEKFSLVLFDSALNSMNPIFGI